MKLNPKKNWISKLLSAATATDCNITVDQAIFDTVVGELRYIEYSFIAVEHFQNGTSIKDIAKMEGVSRTTINRRLIDVYNWLVGMLTRQDVYKPTNPMFPNELISTDVFNLYGDIKMTEFITDTDVLAYLKEYNVTTVREYAAQILSFSSLARVHIGFTFYDFVKKEMNKGTEKEVVKNEIRSEEELGK